MMSRGLVVYWQSLRRIGSLSQVLTTQSERPSTCQTGLDPEAGWQDMDGMRTWKFAASRQQFYIHIEYP